MQENPYGIEALWTQGDLVIKSVAIMLLIMSIVTWSIILLRALGLWQQRRNARRAQEFWRTASFAEALEKLDTAQGGFNVFRRLAEEGDAALKHHRDHRDDLQGHLPLSDWLVSSLRGSIDDSAERLQRGLPILASVGATAPFVGLFGTVWGIYHALVNIGISGQASIDKVAGPVGEALIMTAFGLAVAIPAVLGYNALIRGNKGVLARLNRFAAQLHAWLLTGAPPVRAYQGNVSPLRPKAEVS